MKYELTHQQMYTAAIVIRKRIDAARLMLKKLIYNAAEMQEILDTQAAVDAMAKAKSWNGKDRLEIKLGKHVILAERI